MNTALSTHYWVVDDDGTAADTARIASLPGANDSRTDGAVAIETQACNSVGELRRSFVGRLRTVVEAAHDLDCRLVALGVRPDLLCDALGSSAPSLPAESLPTAGSQITIGVDPERALDQYNALMALDPAFALVNTVSYRGHEQTYACGRPVLYRQQAGLSHRCREQQYPSGKYTDSWTEQLDETITAGGQSGLRQAHDTRQTADSQSPGSAYWEPVEFSADRTTLSWNSPDSTMPTALLQLVADVLSFLERATTQPLDVSSFGNGCCADRVVLPDAEWLSTYREEAIRAGTDSLLVRAYLERLCFEPDWYRQATVEPMLGSLTAAETAAYCQTRAAQLEAELGLVLAE